jgi:hypothetical protein
MPFFLLLGRRNGSSLRLSIHPMHLAVNIGGIPYLAKNERDMGPRHLLDKTAWARSSCEKAPADSAGAGAQVPAGAASGAGI